jgi:hypothetical protein
MISIMKQNKDRHSKINLDIEVELNVGYENTFIPSSPILLIKDKFRDWA